MKENRPKIDIPLQRLDWITELLGFIGLCFLVGLPIYFFDSLPDEVPIHFDADGKPNGYSKKTGIWLLPSIGALMYFFMFWLNKYPHTFNYPQKVTQENARRLYTSATRMMRTLNAIIACAFAYITYAMLQTALGNQDGIGIWFLPVFLVGIFGLIGYFMYKSVK